MEIYTPICILGLLLLGTFVHARRRREAHPAIGLTLLYWGSAVAALFMNPRLLEALGLGLGREAHLSLLAMSIALVTSLAPALLLKNSPVLRLRLDLVLTAAKFSAPLALFSFIYLLPVAIRTASMGAQFVRTEINAHGTIFLPPGVLTTIAVVIAQFYAVFALFFVIATVKKSSLWLRFSCFLGSTLYILNSLCFAARDGVLWFAVAYAWALWYAKPLLSDRQRAAIRRAILPIGLLGLVVFAIFSVQRFSERSDGTLFDYLLAYYGTQPYVFATTVESQGSFYGGQLRFPLLFEMTGTSEPVIRRFTYEWSFGTFVKDLYSEGGWAFMLLVTFLVPLVLIIAFRVTARHFPESYALLGLLYVQFMAQGVMYLRMGNRVGNLYILCLVGFSLLLVAFRLLTPRRGFA